MEYLVGLALCLAVGGLAVAIGFDRDRAFYPTLLIVIATYYVLFAAMGASARALIMEIVAASGFSALALIGFKKNLWLVAAAILAHGIFDYVHHFFIGNPGVPRWWPGFCLAFDAPFACFLALRLLKSPELSRPL